MFGGLCTLFSGDFLQLPHPTLPSLATPVDEITGMYATVGTEAMDDDDEQCNTEEAKYEHRSGFELWRRIQNVTVPSLNLRSLGTLADMLHDIRSCRISDRSWHLLQDRVLGVAREGDKVIQEYAPHADPR